jgi:flagellar biosynthesis protein FliR
MVLQPGWRYPFGAMGQALLDAVSRELVKSGIDPGAWALGWARVLPSVVLVPAFGLRALPVFAQALFAFILAACVTPALGPLLAAREPSFVSLLVQVATGLPVAVSAATTLWAAGMTGNLLDELRGATPGPGLVPSVDSGTTPLGVLLSLGAAAAFLELGGPVRLTEALSVLEPISEQNIWQVVRTLGQGVQLAVLISAPLLAFALFFEVFQALITRAASSPGISFNWLPVRALALLAIVALLLERLVRGLALWMDGHLPPG